MGRGWKRLGALACGAGLIVSLAGCADTVTTFDATGYVKGVLDETYKGTWDAVFLGLVDLTEDEAQKAYDDALEEEYQRFCYQFDLRDEYLNDETRESVQELLKEVCAKASYAVQPAVALDDTRYAVEVSVRPMDLFLQVREDDLEGYAADFQKEYADADLTAMNDKARERFWTRYENDWARGVVELCRGKMGTMAYLEVEPILVLVAPDDQGLYGMGDNDFSNLSALILPY